MSRSINEHVAAEFYDALATSNVEKFWSVQADDVIYNINGHTPISGRIQGRGVMEKDILAYVFPALKMESFQFSKKWKILCADDLRVTCIMEADGCGVNGLRYDQRYVHIFEIHAGKITEVWEFFDTALANAVMFTPEQNIPRSAHLQPFSF